MPEDSKMTIGAILEMLIEDTFETEVKIITDALRKNLPDLDKKIKEMGLDTFEALVYDAMIKVSFKKRDALAKRVRKTEKRF